MKPADKKEKSIAIHPKVLALTGVLKNPGNKKPQDIYREHIRKKYLKT